jgi:hypothetical protein
MTTNTVTAADYAAAVAFAATLTRDSRRDTAAVAVARAAAGASCPRCKDAFTASNPAEYAHYAPSANDAYVSSTGAWLGSTVCRACNLSDDVARDILGLSASEPMPYAYVVANYTVPMRFGKRADIIAAAATLTRGVSRADEIVRERAAAAIARMAA